MLLICILLSYLMGYFMMLDTLKTNGHLIVMDILIFIVAPFNLIIFACVKITSHFFTLEQIVFTSNNSD